MKQLNHLITLQLTIVICLCLFSVTVRAAEIETLPSDIALSVQNDGAGEFENQIPVDISTGKCGDSVIWTFDHDAHTLTISGTGKMTDFYILDIDEDWDYVIETWDDLGDYAECREYIGFPEFDENTIPWWELRSQILAVIIEDGVTSIGNYSFLDCDSLTSVTIPSSVTSIGELAFYDCGSLSEVILPDSVTNIGRGTFRDCKSLTSATIPSGLASTGDYTFYDCSNLSEVIIPNSVTGIGRGAFVGCDSLTSVIIPVSVTNIDQWAFHRCDSLTSVIIPDSVTNIGRYAFYDCNKLLGITIPDSVTSIGTFALGYTEEESNLIDGFTISGYSGTVAERYAKKHKMPFLSLGGASSNLKKTKLSSVKWNNKKKTVTVKWKKNTKGRGYEMQYSMDEDFSSDVKTKKIKKNNTIKATIKKLQKGTWYFRIRTVKGNEYSDWSSVKKVKVKK